MATIVESGRKRRWNGVSKADRKRHMAAAQKAYLANVQARHLKAAIERINAAGGFRKAVEQVRAAGYELQEAS